MSLWLNRAKILLTGGSGFLGSHVFKKLLDNGETNIIAAKKSSLSKK